MAHGTPVHYKADNTTTYGIGTICNDCGSTGSGSAYSFSSGRLLDISDDMLIRAANEGFSGGEKKRMEILQMAVLEPKLAILDETDSGLDIDALKVVADGVNALRGPERGMLLITHYQRLLDYIVPDRVHVLAHGRIVKSGDKSLALELEAKGYGEFLDAAA